MRAGSGFPRSGPNRYTLHSIPRTVYSYCFTVTIGVTENPGRSA